MWYIHGIVTGAFGLATYVIGLFLGALWGKVRHRLTSEELDTIRRAYEEVREVRDDAMQEDDVEGTRDLTELLRDLKDITKRQGKELVPNEGTRSIS